MVMARLRYAQSVIAGDGEKSFTKQHFNVYYQLFVGCYFCKYKSAFLTSNRFYSEI